MIRLEELTSNLLVPHTIAYRVLVSLREKGPNRELFLVQYRKIRTRNNSIFGHFSRSLFCKPRNHFLAVAKELVQSVMAVV